MIVGASARTRNCKRNTGSVCAFFFSFSSSFLMLLLQQEMIVNQSTMNAVKEKRTMQSSTFGFAM
jgi:zinc transporter ZupT